MTPNEMAHAFALTTAVDDEGTDHLAHAATIEVTIQAEAPAETDTKTETVSSDAS